MSKIANVVLSAVTSNDVVCDLAVGGGLRYFYVEQLAGRVARLSVVDPEMAALDRLGDSVPKPNRKPEKLELWLRQWAPPRGPIYTLAILSWDLAETPIALESYEQAIKLAREASTRVLVIAAGDAGKACEFLKRLEFEIEDIEPGIVVGRAGAWEKPKGEGFDGNNATATQQHST